MREKFQSTEEVSPPCQKTPPKAEPAVLITPPLRSHERESALLSWSEPPMPSKRSLSGAIFQGASGAEEKPIKGTLNDRARYEAERRAR